MFLNRRGMEMAIQIFIVLFVLIAVAMLVLNMLNEQSQQQRKYLSDQKLQQEIQFMRADCLTVCSCDSEVAQVNYCIRKVKSQAYGSGAFDFTNDGTTLDFIQPADLPVSGGVYGACEDQLFCPMITECKCGSRVLDMRSCIQVVCGYWKKNNYDATGLLLQNYGEPSPACLDGDPNGQHWFMLFSSNPDIISQYCT